MNVIENASVVCRSAGEKNVCIIMDEVTGKTVRLENVAGVELELGMEGTVSYKAQPFAQILSFEPVMQEELV